MGKDRGAEGKGRERDSWPPPPKMLNPGYATVYD